MTGTVQCVVLDCADVLELAEFYRHLLGGEINKPDPRWSLDDDWATLHLPSGLVLCFQRVPDHRPPIWGDPARPQQFHLDIGVPDLEQAARAAESSGATLLDDTHPWHIYADPAGHPFCLLHEK
ncbi:VOC family protein [Spongiactinospora sp. 9N601]|uniref:VOC family protein n=1 Tax=Spongiactinospora sp. 9N601 TaxID=3375149 RepID=UPI003789DDC9